MYLAAQCCEHLNRVLVIEEECAEAKGLEVVSVVPQIKAGGAFATEVYRRMNNPVLVERIIAVAGIDIGDTMIGMHIKPIAVPVRTEVKAIGDAHVTMARSRPKLIGGERSVYKNTNDSRRAGGCAECRAALADQGMPSEERRQEKNGRDSDPEPDEPK